MMAIGYYVNYRRNVDSEKTRVPDGIWTHDRPWSSRMLYHWATGDSVASKGQIMGIDWNRIAGLHSQVLAHRNIEKESNDKMEGREVETSHFNLHRMNIAPLWNWYLYDKPNYVCYLICSQDSFDVCDVSNRFFLYYMQQRDSMF